MPSSFTVRPANFSDASGILTCLRAAFAPYESSYTKPAYIDTVLTEETLAGRLRTMSIFVAINNAGEIIGTIGCNVVDEADNEKEGHLRGMAVLPDWQGVGVADQLLGSAEAELRRLGCRRVTLDTTEPLRRAASFYERNGYRATGKIANFFGMPLYEYAKALTS
jgi:GNAT superfamily N-acetyltransferase